MIADPMTREISFAEPISWGGSWTPEEEKPKCPFGNPSACPYRQAEQEARPPERRLKLHQTVSGRWPVGGPQAPASRNNPSDVRRLRLVSLIGRKMIGR